MAACHRTLRGTALWDSIHAADHAFEVGANYVGDASFGVTGTVAAGAAASTPSAASPRPTPGPPSTTRAAADGRRRAGERRGALAESRAAYDAGKKALKSDLKRSTALIKKIKGGVTGDMEAGLLGDITTR
ncbi:hypothetical protein JL722_14432 [Aureococcus anophagefferens]|nr:hypothetical protein JL722_14432 [Aureococcus anophagefferens]